MALRELFLPTSADSGDTNEEMRHRIEGWIKIRFLIGYLLFGSIFLYRPSLNLPFPVVPLLAVVLLIIFFNSLSLIILNYRERWINYLAYCQLGIDFIIITIVYQITGGVDSPFDWVYIYVILAAGLVGALRFSILLSFLSWASMVFVLWAQYNFILPHYQVGTITAHSPTGFHNLRLIFSEIISNGMMFFTLGLISGYIANLAENRRLKLAEAYKLLKQHKEKVLQAITETQEEERKRIARELHDETGQSLTVLISNLQVLESSLTPESGHAQLKRQLTSLRNLAENLFDEVHNIIFDLRPSVLDDLGVVASLKWYVKTYIEPLGIKTRITVDGQDRRLDEKREVALYRFLQEALSNIIKHAEATEIEIAIKFDPDVLGIEVRDNGKGFEIPQAAGDDVRHWGIMGMKERIEMLKGKFNIETQPRKGTCLFVSIPMHKEEGSHS